MRLISLPHSLGAIRVNPEHVAAVLPHHEFKNRAVIIFSGGDECYVEVELSADDAAAMLLPI